MAARLGRREVVEVLLAHKADTAATDQVKIGRSVRLDNELGWVSVKPTHWPHLKGKLPNLTYSDIMLG